MNDKPIETAPVTQANHEAAVDGMVGLEVTPVILDAPGLPIMAPGVEEAISELFEFHPPTPEQQNKYQAMRAQAKILARLIYACCEPGPDRTAAIRKVREAVMTANAGIATNNAAARVR